MAGVGEERIVLALLRRHGLDADALAVHEAEADGRVRLGHVLVDLAVGVITGAALSIIAPTKNLSSSSGCIFLASAMEMISVSRPR